MYFTLFNFVSLLLFCSVSGFGDEFGGRFPNGNKIEVRSITETSAEIRWPLIPTILHYKIYTIQPYAENKTPELRHFVEVTEKNQEEGFASITIYRLPTGEYVNVYITDTFDDTLGYIPELFFTDCRQGWTRCKLPGTTRGNQRYECKLSCKPHGM